MRFLPRAYSCCRDLPEQCPAGKAYSLYQIVRLKQPGKTPEPKACPRGSLHLTPDPDIHDRVALLLTFDDQAVGEMHVQLIAMVLEGVVPGMGGDVQCAVGRVIEAVPGFVF